MQFGSHLEPKVFPPSGVLAINQAAAERGVAVEAAERPQKQPPWNSMPCKPNAVLDQRVPDSAVHMPTAAQWRETPAGNCREGSVLPGGV